MKRGNLILEFDWPLDGKTVPLKALYPDSFPRIRPTVRLRGEPSSFPRRHCSPTDGNLCLLGRDTRQWPQKWTLCYLLQSQLADTLNDTGEKDRQGEPAEYWWNILGERGSYCLVDTAWRLGRATSGTLKLRHRGKKISGRPEIKAVVTELRDENGTALHCWVGPLPPEIDASSGEIIIPWVYIDETILPDRTAEQIYDLIDRLLQKPRYKELGVSLVVQWFAILYPSELGFENYGLTWLFPLLYSSSKSAFRSPPNLKRPNIIVIPTYRAGEQDMGARVPAVQILRSKKVAVIGLGALGSPLAVELARNGCSKLHLVDHDVVEPGNSIRWTLGASAWGLKKTDSLPAFIREEYPWSDAEGHTHHIGAPSEDEEFEGDDSVFDRILSDADIVIDATAAYGITMFLSDYCDPRGIPLISLYASPPVTGGVVARFAPGSGCPTCLEFAHAAKTIKRAPGFGDEASLVQPAGCGELTFEGASFDLKELSLQAMRLIVDTLENPDDSSQSVIYTLSLTQDGKRIPPKWCVKELPKTQGCSCAPPT